MVEKRPTTLKEAIERRNREYGPPRPLPGRSEKDFPMPEKKAFNPRSEAARTQQDREAEKQRVEAFTLFSQVKPEELAQLLPHIDLKKELTMLHSDGLAWQKEMARVVNAMGTEELKRLCAQIESYTQVPDKNIRRLSPIPVMETADYLAMDPGTENPAYTDSVNGLKVLMKELRDQHPELDKYGIFLAANTMLRYRELRRVYRDILTPEMRDQIEAALKEREAKQENDRSSTFAKLIGKLFRKNGTIG